MKIPSIEKRPASAHKGDFGRVLIVGGSRGMAGAAALAGIAALRSGAGLVTVAVPDRCLETVASFSPCLMTVPLEEDEEGRVAECAEQRILELAAKSDSVALGCGLGRSDQLDRLVLSLFSSIECSLAVDADGLNALAFSRAASGETELPKANGPRILTPHIGEFRRLWGKPEASVEECRRESPSFALRNQCALILKGHASIVTDGVDCFENETGNPGMATAGSGDVLTGIVAALAACYPPLQAARLATYAHGLAGDLAANRVGETALVASDLLESIPEAFLSLEAVE